MKHRRWILWSVFFVLLAGTGISSGQTKKDSRKAEKSAEGFLKGLKKGIDKTLKKTKEAGQSVRDIEKKHGPRVRKNIKKDFQKIKGKVTQAGGKVFNGKKGKKKTASSEGKKGGQKGVLESLKGWWKGLWSP